MNQGYPYLLLVLTLFALALMFLKAKPPELEEQHWSQARLRIIDAEGNTHEIPNERYIDHASVFNLAISGSRVVVSTDSNTLIFFRPKEVTLLSGTQGAPSKVTELSCVEGLLTMRSATTVTEVSDCQIVCNLAGIKAVTDDGIQHFFFEPANAMLKRIK